MNRAIDPEELAKALCDRFPLGLPYTAYREDAAAIIAALGRAPQAQEETRGAPAPADHTDDCRVHLPMDGNCTCGFEKAQPPAPASPAGRECWVWFDQDGVPRESSRFPPAIRANKNGLGWVRMVEAPAQPEAGAPGTQTPDYKALYHELLYQVGVKHPGESRHETALRYLRNAEKGADSVGSKAEAAPRAHGEKEGGGDHG